MPILTSIEVDRPPADVFAYVTDPRRFVEWQSGVVDGHMQTGESPSIGDLCVTTRHIGLADRAVTSAVTHIDPPHTWGVRGIDGPIRASVDVTVETLDSGRRSKLTIAIDFAGHGIGRLLVPAFVRPRAGSEMSANVQRLKERLESATGSKDTTKESPPS